MEIIEVLKNERAKLAGQLSAIDRAISALNGSFDTVRVQAQRTGRKFTMSASARRRIGAAVRLRWAKRRAEKSATPSATPNRRTMSAAGRRAIAQATKKRWAAYRAAKKKG